MQTLATRLYSSDYVNGIRWFQLISPTDLGSLLGNSLVNIPDLNKIIVEKCAIFSTWSFSGSLDDSSNFKTSAITIVDTTRIILPDIAS